MSAPATQACRTAVPGTMGGFIAIDPLRYTGWDDVLAEHPGRSFFHGSAWARVLHETYGHHPFYLCRFVSGRIEELLPIMEVASPLTGLRGVSLPFSDLCPALVDLSGEGSEAGDRLLNLAVECGGTRGWRYFECRAPGCAWPGATPSLAFYGHVVDLRPGPARLFEGLDSAFRRAIRKGGRSALRVEFEATTEAVRIFYGLHGQTRRRHGLPPQPWRFFDQIARRVVEAGHGVVGLAYADDRPVAAAVFFHAGEGVFYKYGASDYACQALRPNNVLMWEAMQRFASLGFSRLHLGRTSLHEAGLRRFKLGFGAQEEHLEYFRVDVRTRRFLTDKDQTTGWFNQVFRRLPLRVLRLAGTLLYPHLS